MRSLLTENFYVFIARRFGDTVHHILLSGKGGNEINASWIIQLVMDKMPQDEQNRLWEQESFFCMDNLGAMRFHHCSGVCTAFYPCITLGQLILPRAGHSQCSGTAGKADYIRPWAQGIPCWTLHGVVEPQTVPAAESKRGQEKRLWSLWKHLMLSQLPGL